MRLKGFQTGRIGCFWTTGLFDPVRSIQGGAVVLAWVVALSGPLGFVAAVGAVRRHLRHCYDGLRHPVEHSSFSVDYLRIFRRACKVFQPLTANETGGEYWRLTSFADG